MDSRLKSSHKATLFDLSILAAVVLLVFFPLLFEDTTTKTRGFTDLVSLSYPSYVFNAHSIESGEFPFWNPYWFAGWPHLAMPESGLFYPATYLYLLGPFPLMFKVDVFVHLWLVAVFTYALIRDVTGNRPASLLTGAVIVLSAFATVNVFAGQIWFMHTQIWIPLLFLLLRKLLQTGQLLWVAAFAAALALHLLGGFPQGATYSLLGLGAYTAADLALRLARRTIPFTQVLRLGVFALLAVGLGVGVAAVQLLPTMELIENSIRADGVTRGYLTGMAPTKIVVRQIFQLQAEPLPGLLITALALLGLCRFRSVSIIPFVAVFAFAAFYIYMPQWFYESVVLHIDSLARTRSHTRIIWIPMFMIHVISGVGLAGLFASRKDASRSAWLWAVFAAFIGLNVLQYVRFNSENVLYYGLIAGTAALAAIVAALRPRLRAPVLLVLTALVLADSGVRFAGKELLGRTEHLQPDPNLVQLKESQEDFGRVVLFDKRAFERTLLNNHTALVGVRGLGGYHALMLRPYERFMAEMTDAELAIYDENGLLHNQRTGTPNNDWLGRYAPRVLDLMNVRHLLSLETPITLYADPLDPILRASAAGTPPERYRQTSGDGAQLVENRYALPAAYVFHRAEVHDSPEDVLRRLKQPGLNYRRVALVAAQDSPDFDPDQLAPATGDESVEVTRYRNNTVDIEVNLTTTGLVVLSDVVYPGWRARLDGEKDLDIVTVDGMLRGVVVPAGEHTIRYTYRPTDWYKGMTISLLSLAVVAGILVHAASAKLRRPAMEEESAA